MKSFKIDIDMRDISRNFTVEDMIKEYGVEAVLRSWAITHKDIVNFTDKDLLLEAIGEEYIREFLSLSTKASA